MKRLVIAVDCDDVLVPTTPFFVEAYNKQYGTSVPLEQAHIASDDIWGVTHDVMLERFNEMMQTDTYRALGPADPEVKVLKQLAKYHDLHVVTARKEDEREFTQAMLDLKLPGVFVSLDLVGWTGSKGEVCKRIGADVLIDDSARHLHDAIGLGLPKTGAILFGDYPWNAADSAHADLIVCKSWKEVQRVIEDLANA